MIPAEDHARYMRQSALVVQLLAVLDMSPDDRARVMELMQARAREARMKAALCSNRTQADLRSTACPELHCIRNTSASLILLRHRI